jgi:hypothetical protein
MKWIDKGHEFDEVYNTITKKEKLYNLLFKLSVNQS